MMLKPHQKKLKLNPPPLTTLPNPPQSSTPPPPNPSIFFKQNAMVLSPMVRAGTLPLRLLSLYYGADLVFGEEIIDHKFKNDNISRVEIPSLGVVDFRDKSANNKSVFTSSSIERGRLIFQIGTSTPVGALRAATLLSKDIDCFDLNMGCPLPFSMKGGMGVALLNNPENACDIIKTLRRNLTIPISCKIRILHSEQETIQLAQNLEKAGAQAISVHLRYPEQRRAEPAIHDRLKNIVENVSIPVYANGDVTNFDDCSRLFEKSHCQGSLIARAAMMNPSLFRRNDELLPVFDVLNHYLFIANVYQNNFQNTKWCMAEMLKPGRKLGKTEKGLRFQKTKTYEELNQVIFPETYKFNNLLRPPETLNEFRNFVPTF